MERNKPHLNNLNHVTFIQILKSYNFKTVVEGGKFSFFVSIFYFVNHLNSPIQLLTSLISECTFA